MSTEDQDTPAEPKELSYKDRAKLMRQEAYQKAKARNQETRRAFAASEAGKVQKERLKKMRRAAYDKAKDAHKRRDDAKRATDEAAAKAQAAHEQKLKTEELMASLTTGDKVRHLRLVKN